MKSLKEYIADAVKEKKAIGHFNFTTIEVLRVIFESARSLDVPILIGTSESERRFIGVRQAVALIRSIREEYNYPIFLNADHTRSFEGVKEAVDAGYDMVIFDGAKLPLGENIAMTKKAVGYARSVNPDIVAEGELGYIGESSRLLDELPKGVSPENMTQPDGAKRFVEETGIDVLAPAVGNIHGMLKHTKNPALDLVRIREIYEKAGVPLVLHGGSGISDSDFSEAINKGVAIIHINTEIRRAWRSSLQLFLESHPGEIAPYKILESAKREVRDVVERRLRLFS